MQANFGALPYEIAPVKPTELSALEVMTADSMTAYQKSVR